MFDVPKTVTVGVDGPPFPGFNNDVEHLPVTTLMKGEKPIDKPEWVEGVQNPSIPGRNIAPIDITDMPPTAAIPVRTPAVPPQYRLQPGQPKQGLNFSTIAAAPKIDMPFAPIPNVTKLNVKREPWNVIQNCEAPLLNTVCSNLTLSFPLLRRSSPTIRIEETPKWAGLTKSQLLMLDPLNLKFSELMEMSIL